MSHSKRSGQQNPLTILTGARNEELPQVLCSFLALLFLLMMLAGLWLFSQPMEMRGVTLGG